jgi:aspartate/methionine/tyrosine aminotransferase
MNPLAAQLNQTLADTEIAPLLSDLGRRLYFPRGVVAQTAEAAKHAHRFDATVGIATDGRTPLFLDSIRRLVPELEPDQIFAYAPTGGLPELRTCWLAEMKQKNPGLTGPVSLPLVTAGLTHGIAVAADLLVDRGDRVLVPDMFWGNYRLIMEERRGAVLETVPFFDAARQLDVGAFDAALERLPGGGKAVLLLNFPNNPTGYTPAQAEVERLLEVLLHHARRGLRQVVICDDAYFGLFYDPASYRESLFARLSNAHRRILAVKVDGATKESYVWGFRVGFLTFGAPGVTDEQFAALERKVMGAVRSSVSSSNTLAQNLILRSMRSGTYQAERAANLEAVAARYRRVRELLAARAAPDGSLQPLPFNSGYFLTLRVVGGKAEALRLELLHGRGIGTISVGDDYLRVAYSTVALDDLEALFAEIYAAAAALAR